MLMPVLYDNRAAALVSGERWLEKMYEGKRLLIYQVDSPYGALRSFMNELTGAFRMMKMDVTVIDFSRKDAMEQLSGRLAEDFDAVLSFNCYLANIKLSDGKYLQDYIRAPYYYFLVDHPMHHHRILREKLNNFHALCVDKYFIEYIHTYYPHIKTVDMIAHGGITAGEALIYHDRKTDVLFTGSYKACEELQAVMEGSEEPARTLSLELVKELLGNPALRQEEAFDNVLKRLNIQIGKEQYAEWLSIIGNVADHYIRGIYRNKMLEAMANEPYEVEIYGEGWDKCTIKAPNLHYHKAVSYEENLKLMNHAKIVLNTYTGFKHGAHERIFSAMLSKALCMTDTNEYMEEHFSDKENLIIFSYDDMQEYKELIRYYLENEEQAAAIAQRGYELAEKEHTWQKRAEEIAGIIFSQG